MLVAVLPWCHVCIQFTWCHVCIQLLLLCGCLSALQSLLHPLTYELVPGANCNLSLLCGHLRPCSILVCLLTGRETHPEPHKSHGCTHLVVYTSAPLNTVELTGREFTELVQEVVKSWLPGRGYVKVGVYLSAGCSSCICEALRSCLHSIESVLPPFLFESTSLMHGSFLYTLT